MEKVARVIAFYLPQFHAIPENDEWWGKGFTEWTSVRNAQSLFSNHDQPKIPGELGYYNLLDPEVREKQAEMAKYAGIEGFCYWHYWFGNGRQLLEKPFNEVLASGKPDFPFCLGWANHSWSRKTWTKYKSNANQMLMEQLYPGDDDIVMHFNHVLPAFKDSRYMTVEDKPIFLIWDSMALPNPQHFMKVWNDLAIKNGLKGIYFIGLIGGPHKRHSLPLNRGFDAVCWENFYSAELKSSFIKTRVYPILHKYFPSLKFLRKYKYSDIIQNYFTEADTHERIYPTIVPNYDRSPRGGKNAVIFYDSTPELFGQHLKHALDVVSHKEDEHKILFLRSWNEWGEGNYMEPDDQFGRGYLDIMHNIMCSK